MPDHMTPTQRSRAMKRVKLKGGPLELLVQRELRRLGLRFQKNYRRVDGTPDIAFPEKKVAIFIDGDFWHGWRLPAWEDKLSDFWKSKLHANRRRDRRNFRRLRSAGWTVIRIWEHELKKDLDRAISKIEGVVLTRRRTGPADADPIAFDHRAVTDHVRDLDDEIRTAADGDAQAEVVAQEGDVLDVGVELVGVQPRRGCDGDALGADRQYRGVAGAARGDAQRLDDLPADVDVADVAADGRDPAAEAVVLADEAGDERARRCRVIRAALGR